MRKCGVLIDSSVCLFGVWLLDGLGPEVADANDADGSGIGSGIGFKLLDWEDAMRLDDDLVLELELDSLDSDGYAAGGSKIDDRSAPGATTSAVEGGGDGCGDEDGDRGREVNGEEGEGEVGNSFMDVVKEIDADLILGSDLVRPRPRPQICLIPIPIPIPNLTIRYSPFHSRNVLF